MPVDSPYNPDGSIDWDYFNRPAVKGQVYVYDQATGGYDKTVSLEAARVEGYGSLSDTEKREIYNTAQILNPNAGNEPFILGQPEIGQEYKSMNPTGVPVATVKPSPVDAPGGNGSNGGDSMAISNLDQALKQGQAKTGDSLEILGMDLGSLGGIATAVLGALGIGGAAVGAVRTKWPWMTPEGEGFIAPWTQQVEVAPDVWGQEGKTYAGVNGSWGAGGTMAAGGTVARAWTNAAKSGATPATAEYIQMVDGRIYVRSLKTGVIKRVPKRRMVHVHSNMSLGTYVRAERMLDKMAGRIAKRTKALKRA